MVYQALLFCPDEKTARIATQILSELDFAVILCADPFAAVKKLMDEHFDAIVVDCDNEQNATLLFQSGRNAGGNHGPLALAIAEGQAGVAKALRIGANLVLTKPINLEQAKGTLRVARGLLRRGQGLNSAAANRAVDPSVNPVPGLTRSTASAAGTAAAVAVSAATVRHRGFKPRAVPPRRPSPPEAGADQNRFDQSRLDQKRIDQDRISELDAVLFKAEEEISSPPRAIPAAQTFQPKHSSGAFAGSGAGAASAPARAPDKSPSSVLEAETAAESVDSVASDSFYKKTTASDPMFAIRRDVASLAGGSRKALLAVVALMLMAAGGYAAWPRLRHSIATTSVANPAAVQPAISPAPVPQAISALSTGGVVEGKPGGPSASGASSVAPSVVSSVAHPATPDAAAAQSTEKNAASRPSKVTPETDSATAAPVHIAPTNHPIIVASGSFRITQSAAETEPEPAPSIPAIVEGNEGTLAKVVASPGAPIPVLEKAVIVSQGVSRGLLVKAIEPVYPPNAKRMRIEGAVQLLATISKDGDISAIKILGGDLQLTRAAADAVKHWKYKPYLLNGSPVEVQTPITVIFKLPH